MDIDIHLLDDSATTAGCLARDDALLEADLTAGSYHLAASLRGYFIGEEQLDLDPGERRDVILELDRLRDWQVAAVFSFANNSVDLVDSAGEADNGDLMSLGGGVWYQRITSSSAAPTA